MNLELEQKAAEVIEKLGRISKGNVAISSLDPIAKMMLVAMLHEMQKLEDYVGGMEDRIVDRFCADFIPRRNVGAMPALALINARPKRSSQIVHIDNCAGFSYKTGARASLNYLPIFKSIAIPFTDIYTLTPYCLSHAGGSYDVSMDRNDCLWIGIETTAEIEMLKGCSLLINGTEGVVPERILVGNEQKELDFADMSRMEFIEMLEPFDSQQSSSEFFSFWDEWKTHMSSMPDQSLLYITDPLTDRDVFKPKPYPKMFLQWLESDMLEIFSDNILWLCLKFPDGYEVPVSCSVTLNVLPVVNIEINTVTLTQAAPIAKLQKADNSYFLHIIETSSAANKQGFGMKGEEITVRDFDASCYNNGDLYREVRNLYNRFINDYHAFVEYNGLKDGEVIKQLREIINKIGKSVGEHNSRYNFDSGTYVMKNMNHFPSSSPVKVSYMSTMGKIGNTPKAGQAMENRKFPMLEKELPVIVSACGGANKASVDEKYELLRYYSLTEDRLFTIKDIEAFIRKELVSEFGREELRRIFIRMKIEGTAGIRQIQRGLYIDIEFKDRKNYEQAKAISFDVRTHRRIINKSCISMPVIIRLANLEK